MGLLGSIFGSVQKNMLSRFGIHTPRDAVRVLENIAERYYGSDVYEDQSARQASNTVRGIWRWLMSLSMKPGREGDEAKSAIDALKRSPYRCKQFFAECGIMQGDQEE
ncbi:MAG: hypothetical protein IJR35_06575 [Synergistaceae bacterium]|nr:hypothetical protein [Synergistaceae bacterium]MBQ9595512.1 hypothetical protein [Synergistaceae bacterium]